MRPLFRIFFLFFLLNSSSMSQTGWETIAGGQSAEQSPLCVTVIDSLYAVVGGRAGKIYRTTDGGNTWISSSSGSTDDFGDISFPDRYRGTVVGGTPPTILRTEDGGDTWRRQTSGLFDSIAAVNSVSFSDSVNGVIVTLSGRIFHTSDGGDSWAFASPQLSRDLRRVRLKASYGMAVGYVGDSYRTSDGGRSWYYHSTLTGGKTLRDVFLIDSLNAVAVGDGGVIRRTNDGGIFWTAVPSGVNANLQSVVFYDELNGIIGTDGGAILRTSDGGASWSAPQQTPLSAIYDMAFDSPAFGLCVTRVDGNIFRTGNGGTSWEATEYSWRGSYYGVHTFNSDSLFSVGEGGRIAFSSNYGRSWQPQSGQTAATLRDVNFLNPLDGWIVGDSGVILRTSNGGSDWVRQSGNTSENLSSVSCPDAGVGVVGGENNTLLRTIDGGISWTTQNSPTFDHWRAVSFINADEGVAAGRNGSIIKTTDGGETWSLLHSVSGLGDIVYIDPDHIYSAGAISGDSLYGLIRTTNGGNTWTTHTLSGWEITGASFVNPGLGCVAGPGGLISTQDTGRTWTTHNPSLSPFHAISMAGPRAAFAVGDSGVVARMRINGSIRGAWFHDLNSDSVRNAGEEGLAGRTVYLSGPFADTTVTGPDGRYTFASLPYGSYTVRPKNTPFWEQTTPPLFTTEIVGISFQSEQVQYRDIGFAGPFTRLRIPILVSDNSSFARRIVWCGIRPGATTGIWGAYPQASQADSVEGESELPPRSFSQFAGIFDTRFSDPQMPLNEYSEYFGEGSWTDMRPYSSPTQTDTFLLSFLPGYIYGGNYPMTIRWPGEIISQSFNGPVTLTDRYGSVRDMKTTQSTIISTATVVSLFLVANSPNFPDTWLTKWRLLSLPAPVDDGSVPSLFPSAVTRGYSFIPGAGYEPNDTLRPNIGYWLKYAPAVDPLLFDSSARRSDTVRVSAGWNLIGALSVPIAVSSITTDPADLTSGYFFGFEGVYTVADSLFPGRAYWVRSDREGLMFLNAGLPGVVTRSRSAFDRTLGDLPSIRVEDADSNAIVLYLSDHDGIETTKFYLPPYPPAGVYDVRYGSQRLVEAVAEGSVTEHPVYISSARFPVRISLSQGTSFPVSVMMGGKVVSLPQGGAVTIPDGRDLGKTEQGQRHIITLMISGHPGIPADYDLMQNYPNPFNPTTLIPYSIPATSRVKIRVYDIMGREIAVLLDDVAEPGHRSVSWNAREVASGIYFYRMEAVSVSGPAKSFSDVKKLVVLR